MIPVAEDTLNAGVEKVMVQVTQGSQTRGSYAANDYIQRDLEKTLGIDATGAGVKDTASSTATEISVIDKQRNVRMDSERRRVLAWYLKGVEKFSSLVARFMTPQLAVPYIGEQPAQAWAQWDRKTWDGRFVFGAKPDSQIKLDAAAERKYALDLYQFLARDPNVNRVALLKDLLQKSNLDPSEIVVEQLPQKPPEIALSLALKGEDFNGPQAQQIREVLAEAGITITQQAVDTTATQLFQQMHLGLRNADGKAVTAAPPVADHGGAAEKVRPLNQQSADQTGQRPGAKPLA
jgi:ribosomal protein L12E/L44/L45/RPP1/RPP2